MTTGDSRAFGIADGLILIAGVAVGLASLRVVAPELNPQMIWDTLVRPRVPWSPAYAFELLMELGVYLAIPFLAAWTPTCLVVQLIRPRPLWRQLCRRPGFVACLIASTVIAVTVVAALLDVWLSNRGALNPLEPLIRELLLGGTLAGSGVLWCWVTMRLCGVCRPRATWPDRLGRLTGAAWVALGVGSAAYIALIVR